MTVRPLDPQRQQEDEAAEQPHRATAIPPRLTPPPVSIFPLPHGRRPVSTGFRHGVSAHYPVSIVLAGLPRGDAQSLRFHFHYRSYVFNFPDKIPFSGFRKVR